MTSVHINLINFLYLIGSDVTILFTLCLYITVVSVDLTDSNMAPSGQGYQRLLTGLMSRLQLKADFLLSHHPGESFIIKQVN